MPTYDRATALRECIESVLDSDVPVEEAIIIDDAAPTAVSLGDLQRGVPIRLIRHATPTFAAGCINEGIRLARTELVLILNDDNVIDREMIRHLVEFMGQNPAVCVAGPLTYFKDQRDLVMYSGAIFSKYLHLTKFLLANQPDRGAFTEVIDVQNIPNCFMVRRQRALDVGLIDADLFVWTGEDGSLQDKMALQGSRVTVVPWARIYHGQDFSEGTSSNRYSPLKLYYTMRSKTAWIRVFRSNDPIRYLIQFVGLPGFLSYFSLKGVEAARNLGDAMDCVRSCLVGIADGLLLRRGLKTG